MNGNSGDGPMEGIELNSIFAVTCQIDRACIGVLDSSASLNSDKENKTILERFGYTVGTEIGSGSYAKVKVKNLHFISTEILFFCIHRNISFTVGLQFAAKPQCCAKNHSKKACVKIIPESFFAT